MYGNECNNLIDNYIYNLFVYLLCPSDAVVLNMVKCTWQVACITHP